MTIWFTSDTHFGHYNIITYCARPFKTTHEMNTTITKNWNETVKPDDTIYHLGDFSFMSKQNTENLFKLLNGKKHLIKGNHDKSWVKRDLEWESVNSEFYFENLYLCHYPKDKWTNAAVHLHGHTHGTSKPMVRRLDVGVDVHDFKPISLEEIRKQFKFD